MIFLNEIDHETALFESSFGLLLSRLIPCRSSAIFFAPLSSSSVLLIGFPEMTELSIHVPALSPLSFMAVPLSIWLRRILDPASEMG